MIGAGKQRAGLTGGGLGEVELPLVPPTPLSGAPYIDPQGNYTIEPYTGDIAREEESMHYVLMATRTAKGSASADASFGAKLPSKIGDKFQAECEQNLRESLNYPIRTAVLSLDQVTIEVQPLGVVTETIVYTDLIKKDAE